MLETKALQAQGSKASPRVTLRKDQHKLLIDLENDGAPIYYALPRPSVPLVGLSAMGPYPTAADLQAREPVVEWMKVCRPSQVDAIVGKKPKTKSVTFDVTRVKVASTLRAFLDDAKNCRVGEYRDLDAPMPQWAVHLAEAQQVRRDRRGVDRSSDDTRLIASTLGHIVCVSLPIDTAERGDMPS
jgi:hypothetical protein